MGEGREGRAGGGGEGERGGGRELNIPKAANVAQLQ